MSVETNSKSSDEDMQQRKSSTLVNEFDSIQEEIEEELPEISQLERTDSTISEPKTKPTDINIAMMNTFKLFSQQWSDDDTSDDENDTSDSGKEKETDKVEDMAVHKQNDGEKDVKKKEDNIPKQSGDKNILQRYMDITKKYIEI